MAKSLRFLWRLVRRALSLVCLVLVAPLPGVTHLFALAALSPRQREALSPAAGCICCRFAGRAAAGAPARAPTLPPSRRPSPSSA